MPTICPKDLIACPDDLCRASGMCVLTDTEMLDRCPRCRAIYSEFVECNCDPYDDADQREP